MSRLTTKQRRSRKRGGRRLEEAARRFVLEYFGVPRSTVDPEVAGGAIRDLAYVTFKLMRGLEAIGRASKHRGRTTG